MQTQNTKTGLKIKKCREKKDMKRKELAELCGISYQRISNYENGRYRIPYSVLADISKHLGVSMDYLCDDEALYIESEQVHRGGGGSLDIDQYVAYLEKEVAYWRKKYFLKEDI